MPFAFSWEFPAALIGAAAVLVSGLTLTVAVVRAHHGPSRLELLLLLAVVASGVWTWNTRDTLAQRFFPDETGVLEEHFALQLLNHSDCAAFVAKTGRGQADGEICTVRVFTTRGRFISPETPRKSFESPCDVTLNPEVRVWTFEAGSLHDQCSL